MASKAAEEGNESAIFEILVSDVISIDQRGAGERA